MGLSVAGQTSYAPVLVIPAADRTALPELVPFINEGAAQTRQKEQRDLAGMRKNGFWIPFGFLRRWILRQLNKSFWFRRKLTGTVQVSCMSSVDIVIPLLFYTGCALAAGRVADRVAAVDGAPAVRPMMWLSVAFDHQTMDGMRAGVILNAMRETLEGEELWRELGLPETTGAVAEHRQVATG